MRKLTKIIKGNGEKRQKKRAFGKLYVCHKTVEDV